jgi:hypothetical protein
VRKPLKTGDEHGMNCLTLERNWALMRQPAKSRRGGSWNGRRSRTIDQRQRSVDILMASSIRPTFVDGERMRRAARQSGGFSYGHIRQLAATRR